MENDLFLHSNHRFGGIMIGIGSRKSKRTVTLTEDETLKLAYRLMSLAQGGETHGFERFEGEPG